jgi:hypothetical protein
MKFFKIKEQIFNLNLKIRLKNILTIFIVILLVIKFTKEDLPVHCLKHDVR